jgi:putative ABC transport system permease protein
VEVRPILSAMRRNKVGAILVAVQMAVTLAILCNALFIIVQRLALSQRPSGTDEVNLFAIDNQWVGAPQDVDALLRTDLAALRALPGVVDAYATNSFPLTNSGWSAGAKLKPDQTKASAHMAQYFVDDHAIQTLGLKLVAGRNFRPEEVSPRHPDDRPTTSVILVTRALAQALFPDGSALGRQIYPADTEHTAQIIGIIDRLQVPWVMATGWASAWSENSELEPYYYDYGQAHYIVRAQPGQLNAVMRASQQKLYEIYGGRVLDKVRPFTQARFDIYRDDRGLALILAIVCAILFAITAFGIVGLTSYWVAQRRRQIGIRRALGATRGAVVRYFQTENLLIATTGAAVGVVLAIVLNLWMVSSFELERLHGIYALIGAVAVLLLGQLAVLWPALRAASIPPALATRSV